MRINGYLTPDVQPDDLACMKVYYPNHALYHAALLGSIGYLATWKAWELDDAHTGKVAAELWKDALEKTVQELSDGCGQTAPCELCDMTRDELEQIILEAFENMTINNVFNACCCSGGTSGGGVSGALPDGIPADINPPDQTGDVPDMEVYEPTDEQCATAHFLLMKWRNAVLGVANGDVQKTGFLGFLENLWETVTDWVTEAVNVAMAMLGSYDVFPGEASQLSSVIDQRYNDMQCALLSNQSRSAKLNALYIIIDEMAVSSVTRYYMKTLLSYIPVEIVHTSTFQGSDSVPQEYYSRGCPTCGGGDLPPAPVLSGLYFRDWTGTSGELWVDGVKVTEGGGIEFNLYQTYEISGDSAGHLDFQIASNASTDSPVACLVEVTNSNLFSLSIECIDDVSQPFTQVVSGGETVEFVTSRLDCGFPSGDDSFSLKVNGIP